MTDSDQFASDVKYHAKYKNEVEGKVTAIEETPEMKLSKELHPVQSKTMYTEGAKKLHPFVNVDSGMKNICIFIHKRYT